jgi:hypothetical protein
MQLHTGDRVHTGFKAGVTLTFPDGSRLLAGPFTILHIADVGQGPKGGVTARLLLRTGEVTAQVNRSTGPRVFTIITPTTTASVRGTTFRIAYDGTATTVAVTDSSVLVTAKGGASRTVSAGTETRSTATTVASPQPIGRGFRSGGVSSARALARLTGRIDAGLRRCRLGVVSSRLAQTRGGWTAGLVIVGSTEGIAARPRGTAQFRLRGLTVSAANGLGRRILRGCREQP